MSRLAEQIREALEAFASRDLSPALIGGLALAAHRVIRATQDVDFLLDLEQADAMHASLLELGYRCVHRSEDAANYVRGDEGLDLIYAHRPIARRLLNSAEQRETPMGRLRVVEVEGLIALKLQGFVNNPRRTQDLEDIKALLRANRNTVDRAEIAHYFDLFDRKALLEQLDNEIAP